MARSSSVGSGKYTLQYSVDGENWMTGKTKFDTRGQAIKDIQSVISYLPEGTVFRLVVSEIIPVSAEDIAHRRTRKTNSEIEGADIVKFNKRGKGENS